MHRHLAAALLCVSPVLLLPGAPPTIAAEEGWIGLSGEKGLEAWKAPTADWLVAGEVGIHPDNPKLLASKSGTGILVNGAKGKTKDLLSKQSFGDVEWHLDFMIPKGSNSVVKFHGHYEIQIFDSYS